jgi:hypothetical protein
MTGGRVPESVITGNLSSVNRKLKHHHTPTSKSQNGSVKKGSSKRRSKKKVANKIAYKGELASLDDDTQSPADKFIMRELVNYREPTAARYQGVDSVNKRIAELHKMTEKLQSQTGNNKTRKTMTGGIWNPFSNKSPRTIAEENNKKKGNESIFTKLTSQVTKTPILGEYFTFIGGVNNPNKTINPIDLSVFHNMDTSNLKYINAIKGLNNLHDKVGIFITMNGTNNIYPVSCLSSLQINQEKKVVFECTTNITPKMNSLNREQLKESNEGHRTKNVQQNPIKYLYVIGRKPEVQSQSNYNHSTTTNGNYYVEATPRYSGAGGFGGVLKCMSGSLSQSIFPKPFSFMHPRITCHTRNQWSGT